MHREITPTQFTRKQMGPKCRQISDSFHISVPLKFHNFLWHHICVNGFGTETCLIPHTFLSRFDITRMNHLQKLPNDPWFIELFYSRQTQNLLSLEIGSKFFRYCALYIFQIVMVNVYSFHYTHSVYKEATAINVDKLVIPSTSVFPWNSTAFFGIISVWMALVPKMLDSPHLSFTTSLILQGWISHSSLKSPQCSLVYWTIL